MGVVGDAMKGLIKLAWIAFLIGLVIGVVLGVRAGMSMADLPGALFVGGVP